MKDKTLSIPAEENSFESDIKVVEEFLNKTEAANNKIIAASSNAAKRGSRMFDNKAIVIIRKLLKEQKESVSWAYTDAIQPDSALGLKEKNATNAETSNVPKAESDLSAVNLNTATGKIE